MLKKVKQKLQNYLSKNIVKRIFDFYKNKKIIIPQQLNIKDNDKILVLSPHPDDESIGCGGLLLKYGNQCDVICLTDGRYGDKEISPDEMVKIRMQEFKLVMKKLKVNNYCFLGIEDTKLENNYKIFRKINFKNYNYICIPNYLDQHPDHQIVDKFIKKAYKEGRLNKNINILMYEVWNTLPLVNFYIDISNLVKEKTEIINMYKSQIKHINYAKKITSLNEYRGMIVNKKSIECYLILNIKDLL